MLQEVEPMDRESDHIHIIALTKALDLCVRVAYVDRTDHDKIVFHDFPEDSTPQLHIIYRPGHYDVIYRKWNRKLSLMLVGYTSRLKTYHACADDQHKKCSNGNKCHLLYLFGDLSTVESRRGPFAHRRCVIGYAMQQLITWLDLLFYWICGSIHGFNCLAKCFIIWSSVCVTF